MSDPIALPNNDAIALGPPSNNHNDELNKQNSENNNKGDSQMNEEEKKQDNISIEHSNPSDGSNKPGFHFKDEVKIGDETILTIPVENIWFEETHQKKRKSRWGDKPELKKSKSYITFISAFRNSY